MGAGPIYAVGISFYSTALVVAPSWSRDPRWQAGLLYGVSPLDPLAYALAAAILLLVSAAANLMPALAAARVDPIRALRSE